MKRSTDHILLSLIALQQSGKVREVRDDSWPWTSISPPSGQKAETHILLVLIAFFFFSVRRAVEQWWILDTVGIIG